MLRPPLSALLAPRSVAVIGASGHPESRGFHVWRSVSLSTGIERLWPVNPKYRYIGERPCYPDADALPDRAVDLAILCVGRRHLARALGKLSRNPPGVVLFAPQEEGPLSDRIEISELLEAARRMGSRLIGPNSIGLVLPRAGVNASFWPRMPAAGGIALLAQSAMIATGLMDHAGEASLGFSAVVNTGLEADVGMAELIDWFARDAATRVIALEVEALRDPRAFFSALRAAAEKKPVVVLRAGPGAGYAADRLAAGRFGTDAGEDRAFDALIAAAGALRVRTYAEFCAAAAAFSAGAAPAGRRAAVIANGSGVAALAADAADRAGVQIEGLSNRTIQRLHKVHPEERIPVNPVVIGAGAPGARFAETLGIVLDDPAVNGAVVVVGPSPVSTLDPTLTELARAALKTYKPVVVSWLSSRSTPAVVRQLERLPDSRLIAVRSPELAMRAFGLLADRSALIEARRSPPAARRGRLGAAKLVRIRLICRRALETGRHFLLPWEVRALLEALGFLAVPAQLVAGLPEALEAARSIGYPVALKASSEGLGSRSASGLVILGVDSSEALEAAWRRLTANLAQHAPLARLEGVLVEKMSAHSIERELSLNVRLDAVLGPVVEFGGAGLARTLYKDFAVGLPPLALAEAERLARTPKISQALDAYRGLPAVDRPQLHAALCRLADFAAAVPALRELRLEPVVPTPEGLLVLNAEAALYDAPLEPDRTYRHLVVRPAPVEAGLAVRAKNGAEMRLRALLEDDFERLRAFIGSLSESSFYYRFHTAAALSEERIASLCRPDWSRAGAWAIAESAREDAPLAASGRWSAGEDEAEFGIAVRDDLHRLGLARILLAHLEREAALEGFHTMAGYVLPGNEPMERFMEASGYVVDPEVRGAQARRWSKRLTPPAGAH